MTVGRFSSVRNSPSTCGQTASSISSRAASGVGSRCSTGTGGANATWTRLGLGTGPSQMWSEPVIAAGISGAPA
jgi:hypothetical protein